MFKESGPYVVFGYNYHDRGVVREGSYKSRAEAKLHTQNSKFRFNGIAKVTHPQKIWFLTSGVLVPVNVELTADILALLGV